MHPDHALNRASWDVLAAAHGQDAYYDAAGLIAGRGSLIAEEEDALAVAGFADLAGVRALHVQCHLGFDAITFARRGAEVTGVDFSPVALARAREFAERCGVTVEWVCADVTELPRTLEGRFDLAWATIGVLCWIADLGGWMRSVANTLAPGGRLVLIDGHPFRVLLRRRPVPYGGGGREVAAEGCDYATTTRTGPQVEFSRSLGEIVSAAAAAGLRVERLVEHTELSDSLCDDTLRLEADGRFRRRMASGAAVPVLFTLIASR